jgi:hypothetical protein
MPLFSGLSFCMKASSTFNRMGLSTGQKLSTSWRMPVPQAIATWKAWLPGKTSFLSNLPLHREEICLLDMLISCGLTIRTVATGDVG